MSLLNVVVPAVRWGNKPGQTVAGTIVDVVEQQETEFGTGELLYWPEIRGGKKTTASTGPSGKPLNPAMQLVVTVDTGETDPGVMNDTGERRIFMKGQLLAAMKVAARAARVREYEDLIDAKITVRFEELKASGKGFDQKVYSVKLVAAPPKPKANLLNEPDLSEAPNTLEGVIDAVAGADRRVRGGGADTPPF